VLSAKAALRNQEKLKENLENHMQMLVEKPERVKKYFNHKDFNYSV
jgi:hypothetical protein